MLLLATWFVLVLAEVHPLTGCVWVIGIVHEDVTLTVDVFGTVPGTQFVITFNIAIG
jgi:hypothetical protein